MTDKDDRTIASWTRVAALATIFGTVATAVVGVFVYLLTKQANRIEKNNSDQQVQDNQLKQRAHEFITADCQTQRTMYAPSVERYYQLTPQSNQYDHVPGARVTPGEIYRICMMPQYVLRYTNVVRDVSTSSSIDSNDASALVVYNYRALSDWTHTDRGTASTQLLFKRETEKWCKAPGDQSRQAVSGRPCNRPFTKKEWKIYSVDEVVDRSAPSTSSPT